MSLVKEDKAATETGPAFGFDTLLGSPGCKQTHCNTTRCSYSCLLCAVNEICLTVCSLYWLWVEVGERRTPTGKWSPGWHEFSLETQDYIHSLQRRGLHQVSTVSSKNNNVTVCSCAVKQHAVVKNWEPLSFLYSCSRLFSLEAGLTVNNCTVNRQRRSQRILYYSVI